MAYKIINNEGKEVGEASAIAAYFRRPQDTTASLFAEVKALTPESKTELAVGAAKELGWTVETV